MQNGDNFDSNYLLREESPQTEGCLRSPMTYRSERIFFPQSIYTPHKMVAIAQ